jgi:hypothetical protein
LDRLRQEVSGGDTDRTATRFKTHAADLLAAHFHPNLNTIAAHWVIASGVSVKRLQSPSMTGPTPMIKDNLLVQVAKIGEIIRLRH